MLTLLEGPAGSGKSQEAEAMLAAGEAVWQADLTAIWAAITGKRRDPETGRYPVRKDDDPALGLAQYVRSVVVREALRRGLPGLVTTATPNMVAHWQAVAADEGSVFVVRTIDPGYEEAARRLADPETGELSDECEKALRRWYG